ncbi:DUF2442 domain-containing protein [Desulfocucumis palustris]|uniref:DUF2442 domain-containing protein n=1 Tax=Desulfocucumis palustris TaxID=1898651 RepID=UPI000CE9E57D|nr:DUF2442 domain-containing protein [Desulfocucumis palustris]
MDFDKGVKTVLHEIKSVYPVRDFHLILEFDNGEYRVIDARPFLVGPAFERIKNPAIFKKVSVDNDAGTISWFGEIDIDPDVLYAQSVPLELPMEASR